MDEALILPDDPLPHRRTGGGARGGEGAPSAGNVQADGGAFTSPDDPSTHRERRGPTFDVSDDDLDDVVVTGMGDDAHLDPEEMAAGGDFHVMMLTEKVAKLAESLKRKGEAGLRSDHEMDRFDVTLRAYCVGYLAGRRAEEG